MKEPVWVVKDVIAYEDYTLLITFSTGEKRIYDVRPLLGDPRPHLLRNGE